MSQNMFITAIGLITAIVGLVTAYIQFLNNRNR
jgi:hypothetical protein